ncbi:MAG: sugar ABC transporter permease [Lentisphaeria bacterium]
MKRRDLVGLLFCAPWLLGFLVFMLLPMGAALYYSFCDYSIVQAPAFIGLANYRELLADALFWRSLYNTLYFAAGAVLLGLLTSLVLALLLNCRVRGLAFYRTVFFLPSLMPVVAGSILWMWMYAGDGGIINTALKAVGLPGPAWLADPRFAKPALILMSMWGAGHAMVILLAGLQDIPTALYEAAVIDGAGWWQRLRHVTVPLVTPVILFNLVMGLIVSLQVFTQAFIMTGASGAPERATLFYVLRLYQVAFRDLRMGYGCAMAWILFLVILGLTALLIRFSGKWVQYER